MNEPLSLTRREALKRVIGLSLSLAALDMPAFAQSSKSLGTDPNLLTKNIPWQRVLTLAEKRTITCLADIILPADKYGPAASALGVPDFIDEWVSAPYPQQIADLATIRNGLIWLDATSQARNQKAFADAALADHTALLDAILTKESKENTEGIAFYTLMRQLTMGGYFTTREGWKAIGYVGNVALAEFPGPPPEVLKQLGLA